MKEILLSLIALFVFSLHACTQDQKKQNEKSKETKAKAVSTAGNGFSSIAEMPKKLKEISGIVKDGDFFWAISDNPKSDIYKLDLAGTVVQQLRLKNIPVTDVEDVTADADYLYIADTGDNDGSRGERQIIKIKKAGIGSSEISDVAGEIIHFSFPAQGDIQKKKQNENDCEAIISYKGALYLFTKRRNDKQTELFMLSEKAGIQVPKSIARFNSKGLITGATINKGGNEVALAGYQNGHKQPFIWLLSAFTGNNFFSGQQKNYVLTKDEKNWQVESITYKDDAALFFACEETPDFPATLYLITKDQLKSTK